MNQNLKTAREKYPNGTEFFSATDNPKFPLKVTFLRVASHFDRKELVSNLEDYILTLHNATFPRKFKKRYQDIDFSVCSFFAGNVKTEREERDYFEGFEADIVNDEGGVIYDGETGVWAKWIK